MITVMTIAGFDPSGGAGILADIKTISAFGCFGVAAVTSLTLQNTRGVFGAYHQTREAVRGQILPLLQDFDIAAIKTGMLPTREIIEEAAECISSSSIPHVVIDPVVRSTSGFDLINDDALRALVDLLFPLASIITPNAAETERITGISLSDGQTMEDAARAMLKFGPRAVLVKGGDLKAATAIDLLLDESGANFFSEERIHSRSTHGTGCTLASAIASLLACGRSVKESIPIAKKYVAEAIRNAPQLGQGYGPVNHFPPGFTI